MNQERLRKLLDYDPTTGLFVWKSRNNMAQWSSKHAGKIAGTNMTNGYIGLSMMGKRFYAHRLAWFYVHGEWPVEVDHINGDRKDNRISNLRSCTRAENCQNDKLRTTNKSGYPGVSWHKQMGKWAATITINLKHKSLGLYQCKEDAFEAYKKAKLELHTFNPEHRGAK